jgi:hypothetical protein
VIKYRSQRNVDSVPEVSTPEVDVEEGVRELLSTENQLFDLDAHVEQSVS